jgi:hypothetical protein
MALLSGGRGFRNVPQDAKEAPLPSLVGLLPGLACLLLGSPLLYLGLAGFLGRRPEDGLAVGFLFTASGGILVLFALAFLIPAIRNLLKPRS